MNRFVFLLFIVLAVKAGAQSSALAISDSLYAVGNYSEAISQLEKLEPKSASVYLRLAKAQQAKGDPAAALRNYEIVLEKDPERVLTAVDYGKLLQKTGQLKQADSIFSNLIRKYPGNAGFHYQQGLIREKQKDSTALSSFATTVSLDKTHQQAIYKVAKDHLSNRRFAQALLLTKRGLELNPANASLRSLQAQAYYNQKLYGTAITEFEKLLELGRASEFVHTKLGFAYFTQGEYEKAIEHYEHALEYEAFNSNTHHSLGKLYASTGDLEKSEQHLLRALLIKKQPVDAEFLSLALTYKLKEDWKQALHYLNEALAENPENERALYERAIAADNYYKDLETRMNYYQAYLNKFETSGNANLVHLAKRRIQDIREELHNSR